ncbi:MAG: hypothetical protein ACXABY_27475 [Candidatus Thorarchaeota archaeon]
MTLRTVDLARDLTKLLDRVDSENTSTSEDGEMSKYLRFLLKEWQMGHCRGEKK